MKERLMPLYFSVCGFLLLTIFVARQAIRPMDIAITEMIQKHAAIWLDHVMYVFTLIGSIEFTCFAVLLVCWHFYKKYDWPGVFLYLFFFVALSGVEFICKYTIIYTGPGPEMDRNPVHWAHFISVLTPYSFPSGHTFRSVFLLGIWYQRLNSKWMPPVTYGHLQKITIFVMILGICYSRIYLGDHWFSDVVGGCLLACIGILLASQSPHHELNPEGA